MTQQQWLHTRMPDHYDSLETRPAILRDSEETAVLPKIVAHAMQAPGWAKHLAGVRPHDVNSRAALGKLPVLRKADIAAMQKADPPFGGLNVTPPAKARRLLMSPGPIFEPEGHGKDHYGTARALFAAGFRAGDIVHNAFSYHLTPGAYHPRVGRGGARLRHHSRRRRQYRAAARGDRALQAVRLCRHAAIS